MKAIGDLYDALLASGIPSFSDAVPQPDPKVLEADAVFMNAKNRAIAKTKVMMEIRDLLEKALVDTDQWPSWFLSPTSTEATGGKNQTNWTDHDKRALLNIFRHCRPLEYGKICQLYFPDRGSEAVNGKHRTILDLFDKQGNNFEEFAKAEFEGGRFNAYQVKIANALAYYNTYHFWGKKRAVKKSRVTEVRGKVAKGIIKPRV